MAFAAWSCNDNSTSDSVSTDSNNKMNGTDTMNNSNNANTNMNTTPLSKDDSMFVAEAAMGSMMEVQAGNMAQQMGMSQRVKDFGAILVRDHTKAGNDLMSLAASHGMTLSTVLSNDMQKNTAAMQKMTGKSFDQHFISMMADDHKKDIEAFRKESNTAADANLKAWAVQTLPVLQMHMDTVQALKKMKM